VQALSQQTPSTQNPDAHSLPAVQDAVDLDPQDPATQRWPAVQSVSCVQEVRQPPAFASQRYGAQMMLGPGTQLPRLSQT
jgi:hypothetical protein